MYFIGIDISKFKHDCTIIDKLGDVITSSWSFNNDCQGFSLFMELLNSLDDEKKKGYNLSITSGITYSCSLNRTTLHSWNLIRFLFPDMFTVNLQEIRSMIPWTHKP